MTIDEAWDRWLNAQPVMSHEALKAAKTAFYAAFPAGGGARAERIEPVMRAARSLVHEQGDHNDLFCALQRALEEYDRELTG